MEVVQELLALLKNATLALGSQRCGNLQDAVQGYFLARSRCRYLLAALPPPMAQHPPAAPGCGNGDGEEEAEVAAAALAALVRQACTQFEQTYSLVIGRLSCGSLSEVVEGTLLMGEPQPLEQHPHQHERLCRGGPSGGRPLAAGQQDEMEDVGEGEEVYGGGTRGTRNDAGGGMVCWGSGGAADDAPGRAGAPAPAAPLALPAAAQRCLREVSGCLDEVVGHDALKQELREAVLLPLLAPHLFVGIRTPRCNILLHGPPGTGKTLLVEKLAAEAGLPLLALSPSAVLSKWAGESEGAIRAVFEGAAALSPSIIFIDECDALAPCRSSGDDQAARRVLTELLLQMNRVSAGPDGGGGRAVFVMAATNRPGDVDPALLRRFDRKVEVPPPDSAARAAFFHAAAARPELSCTLTESEVQALAAATEGWTGSDLACCCREAAMAPLRELAAAGGLLRPPSPQGGRAMAVAGRKQLQCRQALQWATVRPVAFLEFVAAVEFV